MNGGNPDAPMPAVEQISLGPMDKFVLIHLRADGQADVRAQGFDMHQVCDILARTVVRCLGEISAQMKSPIMGLDGQPFKRRMG